MIKKIINAIISIFISPKDRIITISKKIDKPMIKKFEAHGKPERLN